MVKNVPKRCDNHTRRRSFLLTPDALGLSWVQRVKLRISGHVYIEHRKKPGWKKAHPHYLAKCKTHGFYVDYPHGWEEKLRCPKCTK